MQKNYNHQKIEKKWQKYWRENKVFQPNLDRARKPFYNLMMFPYPSAEGMHIGNMYAFTGSDIFGRFKKLNGYDLFEPIGLDGFGIHSENFAIKKNTHPAKMAEITKANFYRQLEATGNAYAWNNTLETYDPEYYKWTQWIFLQLYKKGLTEQKKAPVNWCVSCKTVLADEQVEDGVCERCKNIVVKKDLKQWFLKITNYAEKLYQDLNKLDWSKKVKIAQKNWIGRSEGALIKFPIIYNKILAATTNQAKIARLKKLFKKIAPNIRIITIDDLNLPKTEVKENNDLVKNAEKKAEAYFGKTDIPILGTDTGFYIKDEKIDPVKVKRNCLKGIDEEKLTQKKIAQKMIGYYRKIARRNGGKVNAYWKDAFVIKYPNGEMIKSQSTREVLFTDKIKGGIDLSVPLRCMYMPKVTGKYICDQTEKEELLELKPVMQALQKLLKQVEVFTTRADTLFGVTYLVLAPEHELVKSLRTKIKNWAEVNKYLKNARQKSDLERTELAKEKTGVELKGIEAINPVCEKEIPIWVADYVLPNYGTGAIMAVPAHDERDWEFAKKYNLPIKQVIYKNCSIKSYLMGGKNIKDNDLIKLNIKIFKRNNNGDREIIIPENKLKEYEELIIDKMEMGFWNEYVGNQIVFIFKHKNNKIEKILLNDQNEEKIDRLAAEFSNEKYRKNCVWSWLAKNNWYKDSIIHFEYGKLVNSGKYNGLSSDKAVENIIKDIGGNKSINYRLRDWLISRQRYWGPPIPLIHCKKCGIVAVPEKDLPILLPKTKKWRSKGDGQSPLANISKFVNTKCPKCNSPAKRETDVSDTFLDSAWYFYRYLSPRNFNQLFDKTLSKKWLPIDMYIGGAEHSVLHLLYVRFLAYILNELKLTNFSSPFKKFRAHGLIVKDGAKMSKSCGNVIVPDEYIKKYGADALRMYLMFIGPFAEGGDFRNNGLCGITRFLEKIWNLHKIYNSHNLQSKYKIKKPKSNNILVNQTIKKVSEDIENLRYNTAISTMMILANEMIRKPNKFIFSDYRLYILLLSPFAPHISEELWKKTGGENSVFNQKWPNYNQKILNKKENLIIVQINGKVRGKLVMNSDSSKHEVVELALTSDNIKKYISSRNKIKKIVYVKNKILSLVV